MNEPPPRQIKNPIFSLYAFHLRNDADKGWQKAAENAPLMWENLRDKAGTGLGIPELEKFQLTTENLDLTQENLLSQKLSFPKPSPDKPELHGSFAAKRIQDAYSANLTLYYKDTTIPASELHQFNPHNCLSGESLGVSLGVTWLLYAVPLVDDVGDNYRQLADACVAGLTDGKKEKINPADIYVSESQLFGSPMYEYDNRAKDTTQGYHIIIWLQRQPATFDLLTDKFDFYLENLLLYRHKILFPYFRAQKWYARGQVLAGELDKELANFSPQSGKDLDKLKESLAAAVHNGFEYNKCLRYLQECANTVKINRYNYQLAVTAISQMQVEGDNPQWLTSFLDLCDNKYLGQIQGDLNYLLAGQNLFQNAIDTIRGMVEIVQVEAEKNGQTAEKERDTELNITIATVGGAIGLGGIVATSYALIKPEDPLLMPWHQGATTIHPFAKSVLSSLAASALVVLVVLAVLWLRKKIKNIRDNKNTPNTKKD
ncbi:MAG TPA: hypothetical protein IGS52_05480 [Oscillatoriaceae cyanobacterium M33_DOE_052]|uniref:Uncharacterized protein n=1 Tax=Planktothricoides sp. SpSt-374 TaxID=2282167 RepID=A0A7C3ZKJ3_9CYAN|nr:hypothetical protein [Oscillatoriaceae cyanobacterium M33_DOE_052]